MRFVLKLFVICISLLFTVQTIAAAKFEPPEDKVLVFIGQDNESVGGTPEYNNGYIENVGVPAGITHYVYMGEGKTNKYGFDFKENVIDGLNEWTTWGAGPMCLRCYLESEKLNNTLVTLALSLEFGADLDIAAGKSDHLIEQLADFLLEFNNHKFFLRIGYEFEGEWNGYDPTAYAESFRRIVDGLRAKNVTNFATVMQSAAPNLSQRTWKKYYPGDEYVDWVGFSYWGGKVTKRAGTMKFAAAHNKPVYVAESSPRKIEVPKVPGKFMWNRWYKGYFKMIEKNPQIKAISYINCHWESQIMWDKKEWEFHVFGRWGDSRIQFNDVVKQRWLEKMALEKYVHNIEEANELISQESKL